MTRPRGRPGREVATVSRDGMLTGALDLLGTLGAGGFTMRALAARLGVTAMTLYHHFGDRDGLISAMADQAYRGVSDPGEGTPRRRIEGILQAYYARVVNHPDLTLLIFGRPNALPAEALRITEIIAQLLIDAGMTPQRSRLWVGILVDFTHGAAIAVAMATNREGAAPDPRGDEYALALAELMNGAIAAAAG